MAYSDLRSDQMVSYSEARSGGFVLKKGETNPDTPQCMTKAMANALYHLVPANLSTYTNSQLVPKIALQNRPTAWRGINPACLLEDTTVLTAFNFMVIKYKWADGAGADLDTFTGIINSGTILDNNWVGYGQGSNSVPDSTAIGTAYVYHAGDNTNQVAGFESVLVNFSKITTDFPTLSTVMTRMSATWWGSKTTGNIDVEIKTYSGGTMSQTGYDIVNTGGTPVQTLTFSKNIPTLTHGDISLATSVGYINYTKSSTTGQISITY